MALEDRINSLEMRHKHLHNLIEAAEAEKAPDIYVNKMKVEKLQIKDEIASIKSKIIQRFS